MIPQKEENLFAASMYDPELGIGSPEAMQVELQYAFDLAMRYRRPFSVIVADLDAYEEYAAYYGRKAARLAHKLAAEHVRHSCRSVDRLFRCGADTSLLLILPETEFSGANVLAERIVSSFVLRNIPHVKNEHGFLTLSAAPVAFDPESANGAGGSAMLDDGLLYVKVAQGQGGNRVCHQGKIAEPV